MRPIVEPMPKRVNLLNAHPRNRLRPEPGEQRRNRAEAVVALIVVLVGGWWLGSYIHHAVVAGSRNNPFVAVADTVAREVAGKNGASRD